MNQSDTSILDWLINKIKNPRLWRRKSSTPESQSSHIESESNGDSDIPPELCETQDESLRSRLAPAPDFVQVDISIIIPLGESSTLNVATSSDGVNPSAKVEITPPIESYWVEVNPTSGERIHRGSEKSSRNLFPSFETKNYRISVSLVTVFVVLSLFLYIISRFAGLNRFPGYFFSDEAMQSNYAEQLIENHFLAANKENIPVYVPVEGNRWSPMASIYIQATSVLLFGKSVLQTRATSIFIGLLGVVSIGLILKLIFKQKYWWVAILFLTLLPAWFLHSRTAFETVMATAFFAIFLLFYLLYRYRNPAFIFGAVFFGAVTFYSYSNSQALMGLTAIGLFISDFSYHNKNRKMLLWSLPEVLLLAVPFIIFQLKIPDGLETHLRAINSYWFQHITATEKILVFIKNYLTGLSPQYWYFANSIDLIRHRMVGYGHIPLWSLPMVITGVVLAIKNFRESSYRAVLIAVLAAPVGGSMLEISIARTLALIVPVTILTILGLEWLLTWVERKVKPAIIAFIIFITMFTISIMTLNDAVTNGPLWTNVYGLYGLQYGAVQIFEETLPQYVKDVNNRRITISPIWANAADRFVYFFFSPEEYRERIFVDGVDTYLLRKQDLSPQDLFVWTAEEYEKVVESGKFESIGIEKIIPYPNGEPGFYVVRMKYIDNIDEIFAAEKEARNQPIEESIELDGQPVRVVYSRPDGGELANIFDKDTNTLMRGLEANPFIVQLDFSEPRPISGFDLTTATMDDFTVTARIFDAEGNPPTVYENNYKNLPSDPTVNFTFENGPQTVKKLIVEIKHHTLEDPTHIHIRELMLR